STLRGATGGIQGVSRPLRRGPTGRYGTVAGVPEGLGPEQGAMRIRVASLLLAASSSIGTAATNAPDWVVRARATTVPSELLASKPGPDAVVLWRQQIVTAVPSSGATKLFEREAVKILSPEGKKAGTFGSSYDEDSKVDVEGAWTLHSDGSAEQLKL